MRAKHVAIGVVVGVLLSAAVVVLAGNLDPPSGPTDAASQMHSLEAIYNRLDDGTAGTKMTSFTEPASGPGAGTMHTLDDIMGIAPAADDTDGALPAEVLTDKTYWGLRTDGAWGSKTGTMPDNGAVTIVPTTTNETIAAGYHDGTGYVEGDADLVAENLRCGVTIFDVTGNMPEYIARTGQARCWDGAGNPIYCQGTGQDGEYRHGGLPVVPPLFGPSFAGYNRTSFTCSGGFTDNGDGTVTDDLTGLIWLKAANCGGTVTQTLAISYSNELYDGCTDCFGTSGDCGLDDGSVAGDWRLPNINELRSLFDPGLPSPFLPAGHPFTGVQPFYYWSSTTFEDPLMLMRQAWVANLVDGEVEVGRKEDEAYASYVWPVRGQQ